MADLDVLRTAYERRKLTAERFAVRLAEQITELLVKNGISLAVPLESQVKSWESISQKVNRLKIEISDVAALNDFIGLRVILLFRRDVDRVCNLLSSMLKVLSSEDTLDRLGTEQFGYQSIHLQLKLPEDWFRVPTFADFDELSAEVQVRTAAQHIWAVASHTLQYKQEFAVPAPVVRSINRVAALLETVDLEFERVLQERHEYTEIVDPTREDDDLNVDLLKRILDARLPEQNRSEPEPYGDVLKELVESGIKSVRDLNRLLASKLTEALSVDRNVVAAFRSASAKPGDDAIWVEYQGIQYVGELEQVNRRVFWSHVGLIRYMIESK